MTLPRDAVFSKAFRAFPKSANRQSRCAGAQFAPNVADPPQDSHLQCTAELLVSRRNSKCVRSSESSAGILASKLSSTFITDANSDSVNEEGALYVPIKRWIFRVETITVKRAMERTVVGISWRRISPGRPFALRFDPKRLAAVRQVL